MMCPSCGAHPALPWTGPCSCSRKEQEAAYARLAPPLVIPGWDEALAAGKGEQKKEKEKETLGRETG